MPFGGESRRGCDALMALVTDAEFVAYVLPDVAGAVSQDRAANALAAAHQAIYSHCGRDFAVAGSASARTFRPERRSQRLSINDCTTITSVVENGTTLTVNVDFVAEPLNNRDEVGRTVPYTQLARYNAYWTMDDVLPTVTVTATWGWLAAPSGAVEACKMLGKDLMLARELRGDIASFGEYGAVRLRENRQIASLLEPLRRFEAWAGVA